MAILTAPDTAAPTEAAAAERQLIREQARPSRLRAQARMQAEGHLPLNTSSFKEADKLLSKLGFILLP